MDKLLTSREACEYLGISRITLLRWEQKGKIKVLRTPGGQKRIAQVEIDRLMSRSEREQESIS